jgi:hypothetical protein
MIHRLLVAGLVAAFAAECQTPIVLHAARLLEIESGKLLTPGEVLVIGERISEAGSRAPKSSTWATARSARLDRCARPPVPASRRGRSADRQESVPQRTIRAVLAAATT